MPRPGTFDLWLLRISDAAGGALDASVLDATERRRAASLVQAVDRVRFTTAHVALRQLLGTYLCLAPEEVRIGRDACPCCGAPHGRPALLGDADGLLFSLSHRGDLALVGAAAAPIGVDVELVPDQESAAELATMLHEAEQDELAAVPPALLPAAVARLWTRKEAYLKGIGTGLGRDPSLDYVGSGRPGGPRPPAGWNLLDVPVDPGYAAAVAVNGPVPHGVPPLTRLRLGDLCPGSAGRLEGPEVPQRTPP